MDDTSAALTYSTRDYWLAGALLASGKNYCALIGVNLFYQWIQPYAGRIYLRVFYAIVDISS